MTGYTYKVATQTGTERIDVCARCREKLGLPKATQNRGVQISTHEGSLYRDDPCLGCGGPATGASEKFGQPYDETEDIHDGKVTERDVDALAQVLNMADNLDVFATMDAETEEIPVATDSEGNAFAKVVRQVPDAPKSLHLMVINRADDPDDREAIEERCRLLCRLLRLNGYEGAPRPNPVDEDDDAPDWEIYAVPLGV